MKITRKEARKHLEEVNLACELAKLLRHFFPDLIPLLKQVKDPRHPSYVTYPGVLLLLTRILSSIFYISSMRKTSEEFNSAQMIRNLWYLCGEEPSVEELPYWETVNRYLKRLEPERLQSIVCQLCRRLLRSRAFEAGRIRGKYWQILIDGTQLYGNRGELDKRCLYRIHNKGTEKEYQENYYYVLEAKLVLHPKVVVSMMTEFVENQEGKEAEKQDCERKACWRLMEKLEKEFPRLPICISADSLYACERFFRECEKKTRKWRYILRYKEGSIPSIAEEYRSLKKHTGNRQEKKEETGQVWYDFVTEIGYGGHKINLCEYGERQEREVQKGKKKGQKIREEKGFLFLTNLPVSKKNVESVIEQGRRRWKIENEGFNTQKRQGYNLEHLYSKDYQGLKNHYYLIQIGHMISQVMEAWEKIWEKIRQSREQKHRRVLECFKRTNLEEHRKEIEKRFQIRLES